MDLQTQKASLRLERVWLKWETDTDPDLSDLGEYSDEWKEGCIDREEQGDYTGRNQYRYFHPALSGEETGNPESPMQDYQRMEAYNQQEWCMEGCTAHAEVSYLINGTSRRLQRFKSGGLWGIESDSEEDYKRSVEREQLDDLKHHLAVFGIDTSRFYEVFEASKRSKARSTGKYTYTG